jgi:hypothetical protein
MLPSPLARACTELVERAVAPVLRSFRNKITALARRRTARPVPAPDFRLHDMGPLCFLDLSLLSSDAFNVQLRWFNDVTWNAVRLTRHDRDTGDDAEIFDSGQEGSATDNDANPDSHYTYVLSDFDTGVVLYTVDCDTGDAPDDQNTNPWITLTGSAVGGTVYLHWDTGNLPDGAGPFLIDRDAIDYYYPGARWELDGSDLTDDTGLPNDTPVTYHIQDSLSGASADETIVTGPQGVQTLAASPHSSTSIEVSWPAPTTAPPASIAAPTPTSNSTPPTSSPPASPPPAALSPTPASRREPSITTRPSTGTTRARRHPLSAWTPRR